MSQRPRETRTTAAYGFTVTRPPATDDLRALERALNQREEEDPAPRPRRMARGSEIRLPTRSPDAPLAVALAGIVSSDPPRPRASGPVLISHPAPRRSTPPIAPVEYEEPMPMPRAGRTRSTPPIAPVEYEEPMPRANKMRSTPPIAPVEYEEPTQISYPAPWRSMMPIAPVEYEEPMPMPIPRAGRTLSPVPVPSRAASQVLPPSLVVTERKPRAGRFLILASIAVLAAASTIAGMRMWRDARREAPPPGPSAIALVGDEHLELSPDRRSIVRVGAKGALWSSIQPAAVDTMEIVQPFVLGRTPSTLVAVDLERGTTRFAWELPNDEQWSTTRPSVVGGCFTMLTAKGTDGVLRCIDPASGAPKWTAKIDGGQDCSGTPVAIPGAYALQCSGWTNVIDESTGHVTVEAGGLGIVQQEPPLLLRSRPDGHLFLSPYKPREHRFSAYGTMVRGTVETPTSAVQRNGRLIVRASSASDVIATVLKKTGAPITVSIPELQLASDASLVSDCDLGAAPRFQLVELAPRAGNTFDPELARQRVYALVDTDAGRATWTSKRVVPLLRANDSAGGVVCHHGHYFVAVESGLWIVDAMTGNTRAALGFMPGVEASFADLTADQIGRDELVGVTGAGQFSIRWRSREKLPVGLRDAIADIERELGKLL